jgi:hypothetical protein
MLAQALELEVADYIAHNRECDEQDRAHVVRNGKARPRKVTLGSGTIEVRAPRVIAERLATERAVASAARGLPIGATP